MRIFLVVSAMIAAILAYLTANTRGVRPDLVIERFSERRETFDDWLAACRPGGACVLTTVGPVASAAARHVLRIESDATGARPQILFVAVERPVASESVIRAQVDGRAEIRFAPLRDRGWLQTPDDPANQYRLAGVAPAERLLTEMRAGRRLTLRYFDPDGIAAAEAAAAEAAAPSAAPPSDKPEIAAPERAASEPPSEAGAPEPPPPPEPVRAGFSLIGLSAALAWVEANRLR